MKSSKKRRMNCLTGFLINNNNNLRCYCVGVQFYSPSSYAPLTANAARFSRHAKFICSVEISFGRWRNLGASEAHGLMLINSEGIFLLERLECVGIAQFPQVHKYTDGCGNEVIQSVAVFSWLIHVFCTEYIQKEFDLYWEKRWSVHAV